LSIEKKAQSSRCSTQGGNGCQTNKDGFTGMAARILGSGGIGNIRGNGTTPGAVLLKPKFYFSLSKWPLLWQPLSIIRPSLRVLGALHQYLMVRDKFIAKQKRPLVAWQP
jgi:hypothetical protein